MMATGSLCVLIAVTIGLFSRSTATERVMVSLKLSQDHYGSDPGTEEPIPWDIVHINKPAGTYNEQTHVITIPVTGFYQVQGSCMGPRDRSVDNNFRINGKIILVLADYGEPHNQAGFGELLHLEQGTQMDMTWYSTSSTGLRGDSCSFSANLLEADM